MRVALELSATDDGRVEGTVFCSDDQNGLLFSGWLELLRLLEARVVPAAQADVSEHAGGRPER